MNRFNSTARGVLDLLEQAQSKLENLADDNGMAESWPHREAQAALQRATVMAARISGVWTAKSLTGEKTTQ